MASLQVEDGPREDRSGHKAMLSAIDGNVGGIVGQARGECLGRKRIVSTGGSVGYEARLARWRCSDVQGPAKPGVICTPSGFSLIETPPQEPFTKITYARRSGH
ncbi:hypothetical protein MAPG_07117 [Magnaporthiopsis poae ATCC 64411]|uniref:Uncharacterized protein n=1 Tax=Magnaporthiopsis poae (strain ATCC 64411 / 73-15) TaxID=644358 RepID=A0A0C4E3U4_MAGP6|nr:hypothetical protein MAPG_07117 [Magnaporthiopsis poae ATCC 64411]